MNYLLTFYFLIIKIIIWFKTTQYRCGHFDVHFRRIMSVHFLLTKEVDATKKRTGWKSGCFSFASSVFCLKCIFSVLSYLYFDWVGQQFFSAENCINSRNGSIKMIRTFMSFYPSCFLFDV